MNFDLTSFLLGSAVTWVLVGGAIVGAFASLTGIIDWRRSTSKGTQARRTANAHAVTMIAMSAVVSVNIMTRRGMWDGLRSKKQVATLRIRQEVIRPIRKFFDDRGFVCVDSPIFTPAACEGTSTLFRVDYFGEPAYLTQSGQLYAEASAMALGKVYCFGPTFRAEKSKTRRHLIEFWMVEPEVAFLEFDGLCNLAGGFVSSLVARALDRCAVDLKALERDTRLLEGVVPPFPRITYTEAIERLNARGNPISQLMRAAWRSRGFIASSVRREFSARYRNSLLGAAWVVITPLAMGTVYMLIFSQLMHARLPGSSNTLDYGIYLCAGILSWGLFAEIVNRSTSVFLEHADLIKKMNFPRICLPLIVLGNAGINFAIIFGLFLVVLIASGNFPGVYLLALLPVLAILCLLGLGLGILAGILNVFFRDAGQFFSVLLQFWFWFTPIVYPISSKVGQNEPSAATTGTGTPPASFTISG